MAFKLYNRKYGYADCQRSDWTRCRDHDPKDGWQLATSKSVPVATIDFDDNDFDDTNAKWYADWNDTMSNYYDVAGYDRNFLLEIGLTNEEIEHIKTYPARADVPREVTSDDMIWEAYQDRKRREYMAPEIQAIAVLKELDRREPNFKRVRDELEKETMNPEYPGNRKIGDSKEKSRRWYELISDEAKLFEQEAELLIQAAYALELDKSSNQSVQNALRAGSRGSTMRKAVDADGVERTYWTSDFTQLRYEIEKRVKSERAKETYAKKAAEYDDMVARRNQSIRQYGSDFGGGEQKKPSPALVKARIDFKVADHNLKKAKNALDKANFFNRRRLTQEWQKATGEYNSAKWTIDGEESRRSS